MAQLDRAALKAFFETGDKPTQAQFADLIDSLFALIDNNTVTKTIIVNVPILGTGLGGIILKRGDLTIAMGEFSDDDLWVTSDGGPGAVGGALFIANSESSLYFDGVARVKIDALSSRMFSGAAFISLSVNTLTISGLGGVNPAIKLDSQFRFSNMPSFADDAAAGVGGLVTDEAYQTNGAGAAPLNVAGIVMIKQ